MTKGFTAIPNELFALGLSCQAFTLLAYALSRPASWIFTEKNLLANVPVCKTSLYKILEELRQKGLAKGSFRTRLTFDVRETNIGHESRSPDEHHQDFDVRETNIGHESRSPDEHCQDFDVRETNDPNNKLKFNKLKQTTNNSDYFGHLEERTMQHNAGNVRGIFDFDDPKIAALRKQVAEVLWCPSLRKDVIDRATAAILLKAPGATLVSYRRLRETSRMQCNDRQPEWAIINLGIIKCYDGLGWSYGMCRVGDEPMPDTFAAPKRGYTANDFVEEMEALQANYGIYSQDDYNAIFDKLVAGGQRTGDARRNAIDLHRYLRERQRVTV